MRDDRVSLYDMLSHAREAVDLIGDKSEKDFTNERVLQLALTRLMEIIGEAANRVSTNTQQQNPEIPWAKVVGMRNRLIHGYDVVDAALLWNTITSDLRQLITALESLTGDK